MKMESIEDEKKMIDEKPLLGKSQNQKGGFRTMPFIIANQAFEKMATFGLGPNMIIYLMTEYHLEMATGSNILFYWSAASNFAPVIGAFVADSTAGRFSMIAYGSIANLMGMVLLWLTSVIPQARPPPCAESSNNCAPPTYLQLIVLCSSFALMSIGAGGIRACSLAFGADQLELNGSLKSSRALESYFSWFYVSASFAALLALSCIVYIQENLGWAIGFGIPVVLMLLAVISFFLASPFYVKLKPTSSLLVGFAQVVVASYRRRHLKLLWQENDVVYHSRKGSTSIVPSERLRFLNKACIISDPNQELTSDGSATDPWTLCTIDQVEELKALIKVIPLWSTGIVINATMCQSAFPVLQATSMDRHLTPSFEIPAASFSTFMVISLAVWIALYDRLILPLASKAMGKPVCISPKRRMGIGLFLSFLTMIVTSSVEHIRRTNMISKGYFDHEVLKMSALWLVPQNCLSGLAEAFNAIGQNEFYFSEFPRTMSSIASTLMGVCMSVGNLVASFIMNTIDDITGRDGKESWVSSDINKGHLDYYYLVLAGLSFLNVLYFLVCDWAYGSSNVGDENRGPGKAEEITD